MKIFVVCYDYSTIDGNEDPIIEECFTTIIESSNEKAIKMWKNEIQDTTKNLKHIICIGIAFDTAIAKIFQ